MVESLSAGAARSLSTVSILSHQPEIETCFYQPHLQPSSPFHPCVQAAGTFPSFSCQKCQWSRVLSEATMPCPMCNNSSTNDNDTSSARFTIRLFSIVPLLKSSFGLGCGSLIGFICTILRVVAQHVLKLELGFFNLALDHHSASSWGPCLTDFVKSPRQQKCTLK